MKEKYIPGEGCQCSARCSCECGCDVDWTPREVYDLREQRDRLRYEREFFQSALNEQGDILTKVIEQRDRLAVAIRKHRDELKLTSGDSVDRILWNVLAAMKGGSDD